MHSEYGLSDAAIRYTQDREEKEFVECILDQPSLCIILRGTPRELTEPLSRQLQNSPPACLAADPNSYCGQRTSPKSHRSNETGLPATRQKVYIHTGTVASSTVTRQPRHTPSSYSSLQHSASYTLAQRSCNSSMAPKTPFDILTHATKWTNEMRRRTCAKERQEGHGNHTTVMPDYQPFFATEMRLASHVEGHQRLSNIATLAT